MTRLSPSPSPSIILTSLAVAALLGACQRRDAPGAESAGATGITVQATPSQDAASTPLPVSPSGLTNSSTAAQGNDLSNSARAGGSSNTYQPASTDNPAPGGAASAPSTAASQSVSSSTTGTQPMPNDGTTPNGTSSGGAKR